MDKLEDLLEKILSALIVEAFKEMASKAMEKASARRYSPKHMRKDA